MRSLLVAVAILCLGITSAQAYGVSIRIGPGVVYAAPYDYYAPPPRVRVRPHCAMRRRHCWIDSWGYRRCHRHYRDSCYYNPR